MSSTKTFEQKYQTLVVYDCTFVTDDMINLIKSLYGKGNGECFDTITYIRCLHRFVGIREVTVDSSQHKHPKVNLVDFLSSFQDTHPVLDEIFIVAFNNLDTFCLDSEVYLKFLKVNVWTSENGFNALELKILYHNIYYFSLLNSLKMIKTEPKDGLFEKYKIWLKNLRTKPS